MKTFVDLYYDDFKVGDKWRSHTKTITEADMVAFNNMVGLVHPAFVDEEFIKTKTYFKKRFASGVMTIPVAAGLLTQLHIFDNSLVAMVGMEASMKKPVIAGDTIYIDVEVVKKKESSSGDRGVISFRYSPINQKGETVADIIESIMVIKRGSL